MGSRAARPPRSGPPATRRSGSSSWSSPAPWTRSNSASSGPTSSAGRAASRCRPPTAVGSPPASPAFPASRTSRSSSAPPPGFPAWRCAATDGALPAPFGAGRGAHRRVVLQPAEHAAGDILPARAPAEEMAPMGKFDEFRDALLVAVVLAVAPAEGGRYDMVFGGGHEKQRDMGRGQVQPALAAQAVPQHLPAVVGRGRAVGRERLRARKRVAEIFVKTLGRHLVDAVAAEWIGDVDDVLHQMPVRGN